MNKAMDHSESRSPSTWMELLKQASVTKFDVFLLGVCGVLSGQVTAWGDATGYGYWVLLASVIFPSLGYVILSFCVAEMTSALPFSGGIYGIVRAFTTPMLGFVVAVFEIMLNVSYVSPVVYLLGSLPATYGAMPEEMILINCLIIYLIIVAILLVGGRVFWTTNKIMGLHVLLLFVIYIFGSSSFANFSQWGRGEYYNSSNHASEFMQKIPTVSTCYLGVQLTPLSSRLVQNPKKDVPIAMCSLILVCVCMNFALFTLASSQYPGIDGLSVGDFPLTFGFGNIFHVSYESAVWLNSPCLFSTAFGFIFFCGRQMSCMAGSRLLPEMFQLTIPSFDTPYVSIIAFVLISFLLNIITFYYEDSIKTPYIMSSLSSFIVYTLALVGYIRFHKVYSSLERFFASPLGVYGAYVGIIIFAFCAVGGAAFQESFVPIIIIGVVAVMSVIYFIFFSGEHVFSEEERKELFKAYLVNANLATKKRIQKRGKVTPLIQGSCSKVSDSASSAPLRTDVHSITRDREERNPAQLERVGIEGSFAIPTDDLLESCSVKENGVSSSVPVTSSPYHSRKEGNDIPILSELGKSLSERVKHYLSSKMNQILPDPLITSNLRELEILQAGGLFNDD